LNRIFHTQKNSNLYNISKQYRDDDDDVPFEIYIVKWSLYGLESINNKRQLISKGLAIFERPISIQRIQMTIEKWLKWTMPSHESKQMPQNVSCICFEQNHLIVW